MERKLASIQIVNDIQPIEGADLIEVATVNSWKLVVKKGEYKIGDKAIYCEIDSFLPIKDDFEFLRKSSYKKMGDQEGFRLRTIKLRGQISQGLLLPLNILPVGETWDYLIGMDVSNLLGIVKYEPPIPAQLAGVMKGNFPSFIPKTDEERVQNLTTHYENFKKNKFYVTEKLDGSSVTFYLNNGEFGVCSRNIDLLETEGNSFWKAARELDIENKLRQSGVNIALQGELIGEGIQGNPYKIKGQTVRFFNVFDINTQTYLPFESFIALIEEIFELKTVPVIYNSFELPDSIYDLLSKADDKSVLNENADREGLVIRSYDCSISFKVISNKFLLKEVA